jgi:alpha-glucosidase
VPLPWAAEGDSFGFGPDGGAPAHLPQPAWFAEYAVDVEDAAPISTLNLYRAALALRRELQSAEQLTWLDARETSTTDASAARDSQVLAFERPGGWRSVTNFGDTAVPLPAGEVLLASAELPGDGTLPGQTTVWLR